MPSEETPPGWCWTSLYDVAELGTGHTPSRSEPAYWGGNVPWMGIRDAATHHAGAISDTLQTITQAGLDNSSARLLPAGTVCLSRTASVGYVTQMARNMATSQDFVTWTCDQRGLDPRFLMYALLAEGDDIRRFGKGTTHTTIYFPEVKAFHICLPPLAEQRRIVAKLDALTARTARARADLDRIPALAAHYKRAVLAKAFSGELTAELRASNHQSARSVPEQDQARKLAWASLPKRRGKYESAEGADWKPDIELPETWRWASVDELTSMVQYGSSAKTSDDVAVPVLRMGNIVDGALDLAKLKYLPADHDEFPHLLLDDGDLLFNRTNSPELVGKTAVFRGATGSASFASYLIRLKSVDYHPELLAAYLNSSFGRAWVATATSQQVGQANVNGTKLRSLGVPLMPPDEQLAVWERIKSAFIEIDRLKAEAATSYCLLDRLDSAVLAKAFRGELVPHDPADEPASVSLDRIRAERAGAPKTKQGRKPMVAA
jgi:type I restriction enzyme, S subunit